MCWGKDPHEPTCTASRWRLNCTRRLSHFDRLLFFVPFSFVRTPIWPPFEPTRPLFNSISNHGKKLDLPCCLDIAWLTLRWRLDFSNEAFFTSLLGQNFSSQTHLLTLLINGEDDPSKGLIFIDIVGQSEYATCHLDKIGNHCFRRISPRVPRDLCHFMSLRQESLRCVPPHV